MIVCSDDVNRFRASGNSISRIWPWHLNTSCDYQLILARKVLRILEKILWQEKNPAGRPNTTWLSVTINNINSHSKFELATTYPSLWKHQKIKMETDLEDFILREWLADKNGWQHNVCQADKYPLHISGTNVRASGKEL